MWGIVLNEAMNQGLPVIATDAVGAAIGGLIEHGKNGIVVPEKNSEAIHEALVLLLKNRNLRVRMGKNAAQTIRSFDHHKSFEGFDAAIRYVTGTDI